MGYNSTLVILNDHLDRIRDDPDFGRKVSDAVLRLATSGRDSVDIGGVGKAVESHHSGSTAVVAVGGNVGILLGFVSAEMVADPQAARLAVARDIAEEQGYRLQRKHVKGVTELRLTGAQADLVRELAGGWRLEPLDFRGRERDPQYELVRGHGAARETKKAFAHTVHSLLNKGVIDNFPDLGKDWRLTELGLRVAGQLEGNHG